jgi:RHS repeat-associated protein
VSKVGSFTPGYDANGNLTSDSVQTYAWDSDGNSVTVGSVGLTFDALDRMVEQNRNGSYTQIVYGPSGGKLALMNGQTLSKAFVPLSAGATAVYNSSGLLYYRHSDWLGSSRLASTTSRTLYYDGAYAPYGENCAESGTGDRDFAGMNQDTISSRSYPLYDALFREYHPTWGRWVSPDPAGLAAVNSSNPQSLNRYAYVLNNPTSLADPLGLNAADCNDPWHAEGHPECGNPLGNGVGGWGGAGGGGGAGGVDWAPGWGPPPTSLTGTLILLEEEQFEAQFEADECIGCVQFQGVLYGHYVRETFDSLDQYFNWLTPEASLPENMVYQAFWALAENKGLDPNQEYDVSVYWWGLLPNVYRAGIPLNTAAGRTSDPVHVTHTGPSYIGPGLLDTSHCADEAWGGTCHNDTFSPIWLFPLHELFDYLPSFFVNGQNPKGQPRGVTAWTCSVVRGCYQQ